MARNVLVCGAGVVIGLVLGAAVSLHADQAPSSETIALAEQVDVDPWDLQGALNSTGLDARTYLIQIGLLAPPPPPGPPLIGARVLARVDCIIGKESGGNDVPNRQGSGASGPGQYFPSTWARHTALYRAYTGYAGPLSLHVLEHVRRVMAFMLAVYPGSRTEWSVAGC